MAPWCGCNSVAAHFEIGRLRPDLPNKCRVAEGLTAIGSKLGPLIAVMHISPVPADDEESVTEPESGEESAKGE